jgi:hypothetical protein
VDQISEIGRALKAFPRKIGDEYKFEYGSEEQSPKRYRHFCLRAYTVDRAGHCALQLTMNLNSAEPEEGNCQFSIRAETAAINRLGRLFKQFAKLRHLELTWGPTTDELHAQYQSNTPPISIRRPDSGVR